MIPLNEKVIARFWKRVDKRGPDECWEWLASRNNCGYGQIGVNSRPVIASRVSWEIHHGLIPDDLWVLHKCDNPPCVNPKHLFLGTHQDNMDDMDRKGRRRGCGGRRHSKLTWDKIRAIRSSYIPHKVTTIDLAKEHGVSTRSIKSILYNQTWRDAEFSSLGHHRK